MEKKDDWQIKFSFLYADYERLKALTSFGTVSLLVKMVKAIY